MDSFGRHDLLVLAKLAEQAHSFIVERQHASAAHESGDTGSVACVTNYAANARIWTGNWAKRKACVSRPLCRPSLV